MAFDCFASCAFGLESVVAKELTRLGAKSVRTNNARIYFSADPLLLARANVHLRTADRIYIEIGTFHAHTFDDLFEGVHAQPWEDYIPKDAAFPVDADSVKSRLFSVSDIQSIGKKAIVDRLMQKHRASVLPESGIRVNVHIKLLSDQVSACINVSGPGLNRRGYRKANVAAPIRETLAAGLVLLSGWRGGDFADPMCGSGTIAIEAAMIAAGVAPGMSRSFDGEFWPMFAGEWAMARAECPVGFPGEYAVFASDIDAKALNAARKNAQAAGVHLHISRADVRDFRSSVCTVLCNPPYARRMGERDAVHQLYREMGEALQNIARKSFITADDEFERWFGKRASRRRKLYNGNIRCTLFQYE